MRKFANFLLILVCIIVFMQSGCENLKKQNSVSEEQKAVNAFCSAYSTTFIIKNGEVFATGLADSNQCNAGFLPKKKGLYSEKYSDTFVSVAKNVSQIGNRGLNCYLDNNTLYIKDKNGTERVINNVSLMTDNFTIAYVKENRLFWIVPNDLGDIQINEEIEIKGLPNESIKDILLWGWSISVMYENGEIRIISRVLENKKGYEILVPEYQFTAKPMRFVRGFLELRMGIIDENDAFYTYDGTEPKLEANNVRDVLLGKNSMYYISNDGTLWGKGENAKGQLGTGDTKKREEFVKIMDGVKSVSGGANYVVAVTEDDKVYGFGSNEVGQLSGEKKKYTVPTELNFESTSEQ